MRGAAALTDRRGPSAFLSPFFEMAPWVAILDATPHARGIWLRNHARDRHALCDMLIAYRMTVLLCGWIDTASARRLLSSGVSVAVGPCDRPMMEVLEHLPRRAPARFATFQVLRL